MQRALQVVIFFNLSMLTLVSVTNATGFQVGAGGLTPHYNVGPGLHNYCNQIGHSNTIFNRTFYIRLETQRVALTGMKGQDSICSPIEGLFFTYKVFEGKWFGFGFDIGGYRFNMANWDARAANTPADMVVVRPIYTLLGKNFYFVPIIAPEFNIGLVHVGTWSLMFNAIVTPIISNLSFSLKKTF